MLTFGFLVGLAVGATFHEPIIGVLTMARRYIKGVFKD